MNSSLFAHQGEKGEKREVIYSYEERRNVDFKEILKGENHFLLLVDENCSVCESLLMNDLFRLEKNIIVGVLKEPHFRWKARMRRRGIKKKIYDVKSLGLDHHLGFPQLYTFNKNGKLESQVYGKSQILQKFYSGSRK